ncbi:MAG: hypothetical protein IPH95_03825 [Candidatus Promineofilum sp.]|nr:hypothetical protein [Promineifilum sp.]
MATEAAPGDTRPRKPSACPAAGWPRRHLQRRQTGRQIADDTIAGQQQRAIERRAIGGGQAVAGGQRPRREGVAGGRLQQAAVVDTHECARSHRRAGW